MNVIAIELLGGTKGRDFVSWGPDGLERFSARLLDGHTTLNVGWTDNVPRTALRLREVQRLAGGAGSFTRITGTASDQLEASILEGSFRADKAAELLKRSLGGQWRVSAQPRLPAAGVIDVTAERLGGLNE